ncbi:3-keto-disaccharide hydrolase [Cellulophaga baltica]|uniref:3-keto-alpha-glucoside-1,2-lyase/3-keto-2-hydroxy-glucal hydratase domain-containing protein n=1 Tax=Cellulophaga baltica 18 TaxID=1348584 RepID=A0AAU8RBC6_9FLAO|nr:DUF1080 domain-containing protein [Cellulophaga baltica]AIZ41184.1 hypothetical protein M666_06125 [Cellulophaga baltica 18]
MKYFYLITVLTLFSCNAQVKETKVKKESAVITYEEYTGEEPTKPEQTEFYTPVPPVVKPSDANTAPSDAIILFNGNSLNEWVSAKDEDKLADWIINPDSSFTVKNKSGDIKTVKEFGDIQLHLEWKSPATIKGKNQSRANSGVFLQGRYEVQILDNNDNDTYVNGQVGAIYKQHVPLAKASVPSGEWNTYDIIYHAPEFNKNGQKTQSGTITVLHNGILVQDHVEIKGTTPYIGWPKNEAHGKAPIILQDHGDESGVSFRNIWVRALN